MRPPLISDPARSSPWNRLSFRSVSIFCLAFIASSSSVPGVASAGWILNSVGSNSASADAYELVSSTSAMGAPADLV